MLKIKNIDVHYGEFQVLSNVSIEIETGDLRVLLGANGHGKSSLLKAICGLASCSSGSIEYEQQRIDTETMDQLVEKGISYISEDRELFPQMSVSENLIMGSHNKNARNSEKDHLAYVYDLFPRLRERRKQIASTLSGGEARMLAIGRGIMANPKFLAIDEPSLGLSPIMRDEVFGAIEDINKKGVTVLLVEQNIPELSSIADKIYFLEEGQIIFSGSIDEATENKVIMEALLGM
jgi:branched-chain amino acid transport system ATP-binding protein